MLKRGESVRSQADPEGDDEAACRAKVGLIYNSIDLLQQFVETFDYLDQHNNTQK